MVHDLEMRSQYFEAVQCGDKTFELRKNTDRSFCVGDLLELREWKPQSLEYTGRVCVVRISYILEGKGDFGLARGYSILGFHHNCADG